MSSPLVNQFRKGGISRDVRLTAASGSLPLTPGDQVELLFLLTRDSDEEVGSRARANLLVVGVEDLVNVLQDSTTPAEVLAFYGEHTESDDVRQIILRNQTTPDETVRLMVPRLTETLLEFVIVNQTRLLRHTPIIDALEANPNLSSDQTRRLNELKHDFKLGEPAVSALSSDQSAQPKKLDLGKGPSEEQEPPPRSREEAEERYGLREGPGDEGEDDKEARKSVFERIYKMTVAERMIEALRGEREARMMLIRDRNRTVWSAVLTSPKMNQADAEAIVQMRNVAPDVLREIGRKREWTKRYKVAHELVRNPKTPPEVSTTLLPRISARDLKILIRDRNVPEVVRRQAQKMTRRSG
ncbi:MAG TPA: hypothetical protein VLK65_14675 [Vicinamibacteria bacterium]|nr:hypothetical protein [Vicinamibacteria bacterium]